MSNPYFLVSTKIPEAPKAWPSVSFCIPTKDRQRTIGACLESIRAQNYPGQIEIVVVDNGSTDSTIAIANRYADLVLSCAGSLGAVRQKSIDASSGEILGIIDDDLIFLHQRWLQGAVSLFEIGPDISTVWPQLIPPTDAGLITRTFFRQNDAIFTDRARTGRGLFGGGNALFRRRAVEEVGGFDPNSGFGEDMILAKRLKNAGYRVVYCADPVVHDTMYSLREIYRKQRWGAKHVSNQGPELLGLSMTDVLREQYLVAGSAMLRGLILHHDAAWLPYPAVVGAKSLAYGLAFGSQWIGRLWRPSRAM